MNRILIILISIFILTACQDSDNADADATTDSVVIVETEPIVIIETETEIETDNGTVEIDTETTIETPPDSDDVTIETEIEIVYTPEPEQEPQPDPELEQDPPIVSEPDQTPDVPPPAPTKIIPKFGLKVGQDLYFSDGVEVFLWGSGNINRAGPGLFNIENELVEFDSSGDEISRLELAAVPTKIGLTEQGLYYCVEYPPELAFELGGMAKTYSEIYKDNVIFSAWYFNKFDCADIVSVGDEVWIIDQNRTYHLINGISSDIVHVEDGRFYMHSWNSAGKTITFNWSVETYGLNFILSAKQWINFDGIEYSENGYTWSEATGLLENETALWDFTSAPYPIDPALPFSEAPVLLAIGEFEGLLYWLECNSGWLFEYNPADDSLVQKWLLYEGDGTHNAGIEKSQSLSPLLVDSNLYFSDNGAVHVLDILNGFVTIFYGGEGEVVKF